MLRLVLTNLGVVLVGIVLVPVAVVWIENRQARQLQSIEPYQLGSRGGTARTAVIYYSRSGNTALAARHIAKRLNAQLFELSAPDYEPGLLGWLRAMWDAQGSRARISPRTIDLAAFDTIYLGSPIWLYSPAPPIWDFVAHNRFDGKRVVLFNTFNSEFKPEYIAGFEAKVIASGARSFAHRFVQRGRMTQQIEPNEMLRIIDTEWLTSGVR